jgi:hypothetical protein
MKRDAWRGALDVLTRLMDARRAAEAAEAEAQPRESRGLKGKLKILILRGLDRHAS